MDLIQFNIFNKNSEFQNFATSQHPSSRKGTNPVFNRRWVKCHQDEMEALRLETLNFIFVKGSTAVKPSLNPPKPTGTRLMHGTPGLDLQIGEHILPIPKQIMQTKTKTNE